MRSCDIINQAIFRLRKANDTDGFSAARSSDLSMQRSIDRMFSIFDLTPKRQYLSVRKSSDGGVR